MATASEEKIAAAFHRFDIDGSGDIDVRELQPALAQLGMEADSIQAQAVLRKYDANLNGKLDLEEFGRMVQELIAFQKNQQVAPSSEPAAPGAPAPKPAAQQPQAKGPPAARKEAQRELAALYTDGAGRSGRRRSGASLVAAREQSRQGSRQLHVLLTTYEYVMRDRAVLRRVGWEPGAARKSRLYSWTRHTPNALKNG